MSASAASAILPLRRPQHGVSDGKPAVKGCVTGLAQSVEIAVRRHRLPGKAQTFLHLVNEVTFHQAGWHVQAAQEEHWGYFDLAQWAQELDMSKPNVLRLRNQLVDLHILFFLPNPDHPGTGRIGWNLNFQEWRSTPWGGARAGAGRPAKIQDENTCLPDQLEHSQLEKENDSSRECSPAQNAFKLTTPDDPETRPEDVSTPSVRKIPEERSEGSDAHASGTAHAGAAHLSEQDAGNFSHRRRKRLYRSKDPETIAAELQLYRQRCFALLATRWPRMLPMERTIEAKAAAALFHQGVSIEELIACWEATHPASFWGQRLKISNIGKLLSEFWRDEIAYRHNHAEPKTTRKEPGDVRFHTRSGPRIITDPGISRPEYDD